MVQLSLFRKVSKIFNTNHTSNTTSNPTRSTSLTLKRTLKIKLSNSNMNEILEETGNIQNLIYMGECYLFGRDGIEKDEEKAVKYFKSAASRNYGDGVVQAKVCISIVYL